MNNSRGQIRDQIVKKRSITSSFGFRTIPLWAVMLILLLTTIISVPLSNDGCLLCPPSWNTSTAQAQTMVDLSTWTKSDPGSKLTVTDYRVSWVALPNDTDTWLYNTGTYNADFTHYFTVGCDKASASKGAVAIWMLSQDIEDLKYLMDNNKNFLSVYVGDTGAAFDINLYYRHGATVVSDSETISESYRYRPLYYKVIRDDDGGANGTGQITVTIYDTPARNTTALYTLTVDAPAGGQDDYQYIWLCDSYDENGAETSSGFSGELYIDETPPAIFAIANAAIPFNPDDSDGFENGFPTGDETWTLGYVDYTASDLQDFTTFTEVDTANNRIAVTSATKVTSTNLSRNEDCYLYKSGFNFNGDFNHWCDVRLTAGDLSGHIRFWAMANQADDWNSIDTENDSGLSVLAGRSSDTGPVYTIYANELDSGTVYVSTGYAITLNTTYYLDIYRVEATGTYGTLYVDVYASAANRALHASVLSSQSIALHTSKKDYTYLYGVISNNTGHALYASGYTENLYVTADQFAATIATSTDWAEGGTKSLKITSVDGAASAWAYFTPSVTSYACGTVKGTFKITALGTNQAGCLLWLYDNVNTRAAVAYVEDVSGTIYFRLGKYEGGAYTWSTSTTKVCSLNTVYHVVLISNNASAQATQSHLLFVDGELVETLAYTNDISPDRVYVGCLSSLAKMGGTIYADKIGYTNDVTWLPNICRGSVNDAQLVYSCDNYNKQERDFFFSDDNGVTWTYFTTLDLNSWTFGKTIWNPVTSTWWLFTGFYKDGGDASSNIRWSKIYECTDATITSSSTWTLRKNFDEWYVGEADGNHATILTDAAQNWAVDSLIGCIVWNITTGHEAWITDNDATTLTVAAITGNFNTNDHYHIHKPVLFFPTREVDDNGDILVAGEYVDGDSPSTANHNYVTSLRFDTSDYTIDSEYRFGTYNDVATHPVISEPMLWYDADGVLYGMIRNNIWPESGQVQERYRIYGTADNADHNWSDHTLYNPGYDWDNKGGNLRMFVFADNIWVQGRRMASASVTSRYTLIAKADRAPDTNNLISLSAERWWPGISSISGNGDIDAADIPGSHYLDYVSLVDGIAIYMRLDTIVALAVTCSDIDTLAATLVEEDTATLNGNITNVLGGNVTSRGFVWDTSSYGAQTSAPSASDYANYWTESGNWTTGTFDHAVFSLSKGTCYYFRAWGNSTDCESNGTYGDELYFITKPDAPTGCASLGNQTDDVISWSWTKGSGAGNTTWRYSTVSYPGNYTEGTSAYYGTGTSATLDSLSAGTLYYFNGWSVATGSCGNTTSDGNCSFTEYTLPSDVSYFVATQNNCTAIDLSWTKGDGADYTVIYADTDTNPTSVGEPGARLVYNGTAAAYTDSGLNPCEHWYYSAWAYDSESGYYSEGYAISDATTDTPDIPTLTTESASSVEETTATLNGTITDEGGCNTDYRGFVWGASSQADPGNVTPAASGYDTNWTEGGDFGNASFTHDVVGLTKGEAYYVRSTAHSCNGWGYGDEEIFLTKPDEPNTCSSVVGNETVHLYWTKGEGADNTVVVRKIGSYPANRADGIEVYNGASTDFEDTGLTNGLHYYYRLWSYASEAALEQYSDLYCQEDGVPSTIPDVVTLPATLVEETTATLNGNATSVTTITERGFEWGTSSGIYTGNWTEAGTYGNGSFSTSETFDEGTCYYYRAIAKNTAGWGYGNETTFLTKPDEPNTCHVDDYGNTSIDFGWTLGDGSTNVVFRYDTVTNGCPTDYTDGIYAYTGNGTTATISGLIPGTQYCIRGWGNVTSCGETKYSDTYCGFNQYTQPGSPSNLDAHNPTDHTIDLEWTIGTGGNTSVVVGKSGEYPLDWGEGTVFYNGTGNSTTATGLLCCTEYFFRVWNYDAESGLYSDGYAQDSETTLCTAATVTTNAATLVEEETATLNGNITSVGSCDITRYYFVWDTSTHVAPAGVPPGLYAFSTTSAIGNYTGTQSYDASSLNEGTCYYFRFGVLSSAGYVWGNESIFLTKPDEPNTCSIVVSSGSLHLYWTKGEGATNTIIVRKVGDYPANILDGVEVYNGAGTDYNDIGLVSGVHYYYRLWSYVASCGLEQWSDTYCQLNGVPITVPIVERAGNTTVSCTSYTLTGNVTSLGDATAITRRGFVYDFTCETDPGNSTAPETSTWNSYIDELGSWAAETYSLTLTGLIGNTTYFWAAFAFNGAFYDYSDCGNFTTEECPPCSAPGNLTATLVDEYSVYLTWEPISTGDVIKVQMGIGSLPASAMDGVEVYHGNGNSTTYYIATDYIDQDLYFAAWEDCTLCTTCGNFTYSGNSTSDSITGGSGMAIIGIAFLAGLAIFLLIGGVILKNSIVIMLSFLFWIGEAAFAWYKSTAWMDIYSILAIVGFCGALAAAILLVTTRNPPEEAKEEFNPFAEEEKTPSFDDWRKARGLKNLRKERRSNRDIEI